MDTSVVGAALRGRAVSPSSRGKPSWTTGVAAFIVGFTWPGVRPRNIHETPYDDLPPAKLWEFVTAVLVTVATVVGAVVIGHDLTGSWESAWLTVPVGLLVATLVLALVMRLIRLLVGAGTNRD